MVVLGEHLNERNKMFVTRQRTKSTGRRGMMLGWKRVDTSTAGEDRSMTVFARDPEIDDERIAAEMHFGTTRATLRRSGSVELHFRCEGKEVDARYFEKAQGVASFDCDVEKQTESNHSWRQSFVGTTSNASSYVDDLSTYSSVSSERHSGRWILEKEEMDKSIAFLERMRSSSDAQQSHVSCASSTRFLHGVNESQLPRGSQKMSHVMEVDRKLKEQLYLAGETTRMDYYDTDEELTHSELMSQTEPAMHYTCRRNRSSASSSTSSTIGSVIRERTSAMRPRYLKWFKPEKLKRGLFRADADSPENSNDFAQAEDASFRRRLQAFRLGESDNESNTISADFAALHQPQVNDEQALKDQAEALLAQAKAREDELESQLQALRDQLEAERQEKQRLRSRIELVAKVQHEKQSEKQREQDALTQEVGRMQQQISALEIERKAQEERAQGHRKEIEQKDKEMANLRHVFDEQLERALQLEREKHWEQKLVRGGVFIKHGRRGSPHKALVYCDKDLKNLFYCNMKKLFGNVTHSMLSLETVQEVRNGMKTEVFKKSGNADRVFACFSLVWKDYTLDLELPYYPKDHKDRDRLIEEHRNEWLAAFRCIIERNKQALKEEGLDDETQEKLRREQEEEEEEEKETELG